MPRFTSILTVALLLSAATLPASAKAKGAEPAKPAKPKQAAAERVGLVLKVEATQLTLQTYGKAQAELVIPVDAKTQVLVNGDAAVLTDIKPGMQVVVSPATGTAQKVMAHKEGKKKKDKKKDSPSP